MTDPVPRRFAAALSFPGERRGFVERVAAELAITLTSDCVLYDRYHEAEFAVPDLDSYLPKLYLDESELVVIFLCPEYKQKRWCRLEWRYIKQLIATAEQRRIMLVSFGNPGDLTEIGILPGDGYLDIGERRPEEIANLILKRAGAARHLTPEPRTLPDALQRLLETVRDPHSHISLTAEQAKAIRDHKPAALTEYRLRTIAEWSLPQHYLDKRFVNLTLLLDRGEAEQERWQKAEEFRFDDLRDVLKKTEEHPALVLLGAPGSGKSTLLRRLQLDHSGPLA